MASSSHQGTASDNPHFFKVVLAHALKEQKLEIPKKFVREHGRIALLNNETCVKVGDGREWKVGLIKNNGRVWFDDGWQNFVEFYSVGLEYFLVFRYETQSSSFHVLIFDLTATEIDYPTKQICIGVAEEKVKMETDLDHLALVSHPQDFKVGEVRFSTRKSMNSEKKPPSTSSERARAMAKATSLQSTTLNPSFMCKIWPSHIHPGKSLNVPRSFAEMHLEEAIEIILQVSDGRMWVARCRIYQGPKMQRMTDFRNGWKNFARDNNLEVGDVCVFEMIRKNSKRASFKVEIFRAS